MHHVTYLVFDEADRMFDMGFEPQVGVVLQTCNTPAKLQLHCCIYICTQVRSLLGQVRPDRQTLLFSATMPRKVESLVADALTGPVRITVGAVGVANEDVRQVWMGGLQ